MMEVVAKLRFDVSEANQRDDDNMAELFVIVKPSLKD